MNGEANLDQVIELLDLLPNYWICVDGGWGVDALLGVQRRPHSDLDLIIRKDEESGIRRELSRIGFEHLTDEDGIVYAKRGLFVDLHVLRFDDHGIGHFDLPGGGTWPIPPAAVEATGNIGGRQVRCLSVNAQIQFHAQGYALTDKDRDDMQALHVKYGCVLPLSFYT